MSTSNGCAVGKRLRIIRPVAGTPIGAEGQIVKIIYGEDGQIAHVEVLIETDPKHIHGTVVYPMEYLLLDV